MTLPTYILSLLTLLLGGTSVFQAFQIKAMKRKAEAEAELAEVSNETARINNMQLIINGMQAEIARLQGQLEIVERRNAELTERLYGLQTEIESYKGN